MVNRGVAGIDSVWLLEHLKEQILDLEPSKLVILIGINDIGRGYPVQDVVNRISDIIMTIRNNATVGERNQQLAVLPGVTYVDLFDYLTDAQGQLNANYTTDGLYLNPQAYQVIAEPIIKEILE